MINPLQNLLKSFDLQGFDYFTGHGFKFFIVDHGGASRSFFNGYQIERSLTKLYVSGKNLSMKKKILCGLLL
jgi:hypothetical protein